MSPEQDKSTLVRLQNIIKANFDLDEGRLVPNATLEDLGIDSMSTIDLLFNIEDDFGVTIGREQIELKTVQNVVDYIDRLVAEQGGAKIGETAA